MGMQHVLPGPSVCTIEPSWLRVCHLTIMRQEAQHKSYAGACCIAWSTWKRALAIGWGRSCR